LRWVWDAEKNAINKRKHGLSFETASLVFDDPLATSRRDEYTREERWQTIGMISHALVLVVHTALEIDDTGAEIGRIISARKATAHERRVYEEEDF